MNNYGKIDEALNSYIKDMDNLSYKTESDLILATLGDLKNIAEGFNKTSDIKVKSIVASEGAIIAFGVTSSHLINTCNELKRQDILLAYKKEIERIFGLYIKDKRFIDNTALNREIKKTGIGKIEYPEPITNMFLNTASILACRLLLGKYITDVNEALKHIEEYLVNNYLKNKDEAEVRQIIV